MKIEIVPIEEGKYCEVLIDDRALLKTAPVSAEMVEDLPVRTLRTLYNILFKPDELKFKDVEYHVTEYVNGIPLGIRRKPVKGIMVDGIDGVAIRYDIRKNRWYAELIANGTKVGSGSNKESVLRQLAEDGVWIALSSDSKEDKERQDGIPILKDTDV